MPTGSPGFYRRAYSGLPPDVWVISGAMFVNRFGTMVLPFLALNLGVSFGPAIGGFLATVSFVWLFVVDASTTFLCAMVLIGWFGWKRNASQQEMDARLRPAIGQDPVSPMRDGSFVIFFLLVLAVAIVFFQFHVTYPLYLRDHYGLSKPATGLIYAVNTVVVVVFEMLLLEFVRKWPTMQVIAWGGFFSCLGFGMLPFGNSVAFCVLSMLVITLGEMMWMPLATAWAAKRSVRGDRGRYMGWYAMTYSMAAVIAPIVGGRMSDYDPDLFWYLSLAIAVLCLAGFRMLNRRLESETRLESESLLASR